MEKDMAIHSRTLAWKIPCSEEPGGLQSVGLLRVGRDWAHTRLHTQITCWSQEASQRGRKQLELILGTQTLATVILGVLFLPRGYWRWQVPFWNPLPSLLALGSTHNPHQPAGTSTRMPPAKQLARWKYSPAHQQTCCLRTPEPTAAPDLAL